MSAPASVPIVANSPFANTTIRCVLPIPWGSTAGHLPEADPAADQYPNACEFRPTDRIYVLNPLRINSLRSIEPSFTGDFAIIAFIALVAFTILLPSTPAMLRAVPSIMRAACSRSRAFMSMHLLFTDVISVELRLSTLTFFLLGSADPLAIPQPASIAKPQAGSSCGIQSCDRNAPSPQPE